MERKTTQRIVGILVAVALLVILMPLVFSKNDLPAQTASVKAPAFPDQPTPTEINTAASESSSGTAEITPEMAKQINGMSVSSSDPKTDSQSMTQAQMTTGPTSTVPPEAVPPMMTGDTVTPMEESNSISASSQMSAEKTELDTNQVDKSGNANPTLGSTVKNEGTPIPDTLSTNPPSTKNPSSQIVTQSTSADNQSMANSPTPSQLSPSLTSSEKAPSASPEPDQKSATNDKQDPVIKINENSATLSRADKVEEDVSKGQPATLASDAELNSESTSGQAETDHSASRQLKHTTAAHPTKHPKLSTKGWVIQMGSFRDKDNAHRLADRLRSAGYKAFMHEVKSARGSTQTRVYIGPEEKQMAATQLSNQVAQEMNMHGLVMLYKPFEL